MSCDAVGGVQDRKAGEIRMKGIRSNAPAGHEAKLAYYERQLQIVVDEIERIQRGERQQDMIVLDDMDLGDDEAELVSNPGMDQGDVGGVGGCESDASPASPTMDVDPGVPIPTLVGEWVQGWIQIIWVGGTLLHLLLWRFP